MMEERIKKAFDVVVMDEGMKYRVKQGLKQRKRPVRHVWATVCCFVVILCMAGSYYAYFTPVTAISVGTDPEIELQVNCFDRVIGATDEEMSIRHKYYADAVEEIVAHCENEKDIVVYVVTQSEEKCSDMESQVAIQAKIQCHGATVQEAHEAQAYGFTLAEYKVYQQLRMYDPDLTPEEARKLTLEEMMRRYEELKAALEQKLEEIEQRYRDHHHGHE